MHELSIAAAVVEQVEETVVANGGGRVASLRLRVGELSGVVTEALAFSFTLASEGTLLAGAALETEAVPGLARCGGCGRETETGLPPLLWCPDCGLPLTELLSGRELEIAEVVLTAPADAGPPNGGPPDAPGRIRGDDPDTPEEATHVPSR